MVIMLEEFLFDRVHTYNIMTSVVEYHFRVYKKSGLKEILMFFEVEDCGVDKNWAHALLLKKGFKIC